MRRDPGYRPKVTIVVPTYNEAGLIREKLDNIASQDYPKELLEIIVVDSAGSDDTSNIVREWMESMGSLGYYTQFQLFAIYNNKEKEY